VNVLAFMKWFNEGNTHFQEGQYDQAIECWEKALKIGKDEKIDQVISKSLMNIGTAHSLKGNWNKALEYYHQSLEIENKREDISGIAECLMNMGDAFFALEKWESARNYYEQSLEIYEGDDRDKARMLLNMGLALFSDGRWNEAIASYKQSLELFKELKDSEGISKVLANLGIAARNLGQWEEAIQYYEQSLEIDQKLGDSLGRATSLMNIGIALEILGNIKEAIKNYQQSLAIFREIGNEQGVATCLLNIGNAFEILKKWDKSLDFYEQSLKLFEKLGDKSNVSKCLTNMGIVLRNLGKWKEAIENYHKSMSWFEEINDEAALSKCLLDLGVVYYSMENWELAVKYYEKSRNLFQKLGDRPGEALACQNLGWGYQKHNEKGLALKFFTEALGIHTTLVTQISSEKYRELYAKEYEVLPQIIESLTDMLDQPIEIKEYIPDEEIENSADFMSGLLSQLRNNITELNAAVETQSTYQDLSKNISILMERINKTFVTFSQTEKVKGEKVSKSIFNSVETIVSLLKLCESCKEGARSTQILQSFDEIYARLKTALPELDLIQIIDNQIRQLKDEETDFISRETALKLRFLMLAWIKGLFNISLSNKKLYIDNIGKFNEIAKSMDKELNKISQQINQEELNYSKQVLGYLILIKKDSGLPIYKWNFIKVTFDADLVGGFLSAIQSFGIEIIQQRTSMEKLAYKDFEINFQDGEYIRCALILKGDITDLLSKRLKDFVFDFEWTFKDYLKGSLGDLRVFNPTDMLIKKYFNFNNNI